MSTTDEAAAPDEIAALKRSCRILANITARNHQVMEAARIEMGQNGPHAAMQWILNNLPDVWDDDETAWDGKESAEEWFDRTESFYRAAQADAEPAVPPPPVAAALDPKHIQAALEALSAAVAGAEHEHQKKRYKAAWAALDALEGKDSAEEERLPRLCPACLHDGVLERTLERAKAAEGKLATLEQHLGAVMDALGAAEVSAAYDYKKRVYRAAAEAFTGILAITGTEGDEGRG